jgi:hypothetical protein
LHNGADRNCACKRKNQKNLPDETVSRFHAAHYAWNWFLASAASISSRSQSLHRIFRGVVVHWLRARGDFESIHHHFGYFGYSYGTTVMTD